MGPSFRWGGGEPKIEERTMPLDILMPALSPTMEKGTLAKWLVKEGDAVKSGQVLAEIETDKATMEFESADEGTVGKIFVAAGTEDVSVGTKIAVLLEEGESADSVSAAAAKPMPAKDAAPQPTVAAAAPAPVAKAPPSDNDRIVASPLAKRIAAQSGIDLSKVQGSGPGGRIVKADVAKAPTASIAAAPIAAAPSAAPAVAVPSAAPTIYAPPPDVPYDEVKLPGMRKVIAKRMTESKTTVPHFYLTIDVEMDKLMKVRAELNSKLEKQGVKLSVNDFVIRACGLALKKAPDANAMFAGDKVYKFKRADISVAVAVEGGLVTPVIKGACSKGLAEISAEMKVLAEKAREGKLLPEEYQGGTFSISNLGMHGIKQFEAVINPPQGAILAVGAGEQRPVVKDGALAIATVMCVTLSVDHRVLDGAIGADFLKHFKAMIEDPLMMLA
jgi:pyruvate dehydrogenase E2 component (dihydrolipoamide acetyltransferase)